MNRLFIVLLLLSLSSCAKKENKATTEKQTETELSAQDCGCPENDFASKDRDTLFTFQNGKAIALCGFRHENGDFSEFVLAECGSDKIIDFWDAVKTFHITIKKDTLMLNEIQLLPVGADFKYDSIPFIKEKLFFDNGQLKRVASVNRDIPKYNDKQIAVIITEFENMDRDIDESKMTLVNKLFVGAISGSDKAREYFNEFPSKVDILDGAYSEEYSELKAMLVLWDSDNVPK